MERFLSYDRLISHHRNKLDVKEFPQDKLNIAYLDNKFDQFFIHLDNEDVELIKKTLTEIFNQLQSGDEVFKYAINRPEMLDRVFDYLIYFKDDPQAETVRTIASQCFKQFCLVLNVKQVLHEGNYLKFIHKTFEDASESVKLNVYQGLIYFSQSRYGIDTLLSNGILQQNIKRIVEEQSLKVIQLILILINEIINAQTAPQIALQCGIIQNLKLYLNCSNDKVRENVILNYGSISLCEEGKKDTVEEGSLIVNILRFLKEDKLNLPILIASTRYLMSASILKRGKVEIYENDGLESCMSLLEKNEDEQLILNILQLIANVAEEPRGRKKMNESYLGKIERFLTHGNKLINEQAGLTRDVIIWKP